MRRLPTLPCALLLALLLPAARASAQSLPAGFADSLVAGGLDLPVAFDFVPDGRVLVVEQYSGNVRLVRPGAVASADTVLTVPNVTNTGERGLLGIALDPQFPSRPYIYTHQTVSGMRIHVSRWTLTGDLGFTGNGRMTADPASRFDLLDDLRDEASNHNGGTVRFGPDGMLYVSLGEDADACAAQEPDSAKGKILRLDVSRLPAGPGVAPKAVVTPPDNPFVASPDSTARLVFALGLRNPFRFQVDAVRNWLVIGDVGQSQYEEMDLLGLGDGATAGPQVASPGANFGWPWLEGNVSLISCGGTAPATSAPAFVLDRIGLNAVAIISAGAYHAVNGGAANWPAAYEGDLFFSEYYSGLVRRLKQQAGGWSIAPQVSGQADPNVWASGYTAASDWRVGPDGALWYCREYTDVFRQTGRLGRIVAIADTTAPPPPMVPPLRIFASPSPARDIVTLTYDLPAGDVIDLRVYDTRGRRVRELVPLQAETALRHVQTWDGRDDDGRAAPSGLYWARLRFGNRHTSCRIVLAR